MVEKLASINLKYISVSCLVWCYWSFVTVICFLYFRWWLAVRRLLTKMTKWKWKREPYQDIPKSKHRNTNITKKKGNEIPPKDKNHSITKFKGFKMFDIEFKSLLIRVVNDFKKETKWRRGMNQLRNWKTQMKNSATWLKTQQGNLYLKTKK